VVENSLALAGSSGHRSMKWMLLRRTLVVEPPSSLCPQLLHSRLSVFGLPLFASNFSSSIS
jgi:hypothetical protein